MEGIKGFILIIAITTGSGLALYGLFRVVLNIMEVMDGYRQRKELLDLEVKEKRVVVGQAQLQLIQRDEHGMLPLVYDLESRLFRDPETLRQFSMTVVKEIRPELEQIQAMVRMLAATTGTSMRQLENGMAQMMPMLSDVLQPLPRVVKAVDLFTEQKPTLATLPIGVGVDGVVTASIHKMMHTVAIGRTEAGKSTWLLSFLAAVIASQEPVEVLAIDISGSAFNILSFWRRLRYPVARSVEQAKALFQVVEEERTRRIALYEQQPLASDLATYNELASDPLLPWLVVIDEGVLLLSQRGIGDILRNLVLGTRQYGIYAIITGHSANATVFDTVVRGSLVTKLGFTTEAGTLRVLFGEEPPTVLDKVPGRMWASVGGRELEQMQGPLIKRKEFHDLLAAYGELGPPAYTELPVSHVMTREEQDAEIERHLSQSKPPTSVWIEERVFGPGHKGGSYYKRVKAIKDRMEAERVRATISSISA